MNEMHNTVSPVKNTIEQLTHQEQPKSDLMQNLDQKDTGNFDINIFKQIIENGNKKEFKSYLDKLEGGDLLKALQFLLDDSKEDYSEIALDNISYFIENNKISKIETYKIFIENGWQNYLLKKIDNFEGENINYIINLLITNIPNCEQGGIDGDYIYEMINNLSKFGTEPYKTLETMIENNDSGDVAYIIAKKFRESDILLNEQEIIDLLLKYKVIALINNINEFSAKSHFGILKKIIEGGYLGLLVDNINDLKITQNNIINFIEEEIYKSTLYKDDGSDLLAAIQKQLSKNK